MITTLPLLLALFAPTAQDSAPSQRDIQRMIDRSRWEEAEAALEAATKEREEDPQAWFHLAYVRHARGNWRGAIEAGLVAAEFGEVRATALYNLTCAHSLLGEIDSALESLEQAQAAGFLDFDLMATDGDLDPLRDNAAFTLPKQHSYRDFKGRNRVEMRHHVIEPRDFDPEREYPVLVAFAPGSGARSTDWMLDEVFGDAREQSEWIVVGLVPPERGWFTHPTHHALEDLLKELRESYQVEGKLFHLFGIAGSCRAALTYSAMSGKYFRSMTLVNSAAWDNYDSGDARRWKKMSVLQLIGETAPMRAQAEEADAWMRAKKVSAALVVLPGEGGMLDLGEVPMLARLATAHLEPAEGAKGSRQ